MRKVKYVILIFFLILGLLSALYLPHLNVPISSGQERERMEDIHIFIDTVSYNAAYLDVLIKIDETSSEYCEYNEKIFHSSLLIRK